MAPPDISFVIAAFNAQSTLQETLDSLRAQTRSNWEAIVVDDGSSDGTLALAQATAAAEPRVRVVTRANGGESAARNTGLEHVRTDWVAFLDSDDWLLPRYVECMQDALVADPTADFVHCAWLRVAIDGHQSAPVSAPREQEMFGHLVTRNCFAIHACVVRLSLVREVGGFDASLKTCPDWDLWLRVARMAPRFAWVEDALACYRLRPFSAATDPAQLLTDGLRVIARAVEADARVPRADPRYAPGGPPARMPQTQMEQLCWCAGVAIGQGKPTGPLFELVPGHGGPLTVDFVADYLMAAVPVPCGQLSAAWPVLWPKVEGDIDVFLLALEARLGQAEFAARSKASLMRRILLWAVPEFSRRRDSVTDTLDALAKGRVPAPDWRRVAGEYRVELEEFRAWSAQLQAQVTELSAQKVQHDQRILELEGWIRDLESTKQWLEEQRRAWQTKAEEELAAREGWEQRVVARHFKGQAWRDRAISAEARVLALEHSRWFQRLGLSSLTRRLLGGSRS